MDISSLTFQQMLRPGSDLKGCTVAERCSIDFLINQRSLLDTLVTAGGDHADYMSCFVKGFCEANSRSGARLLLREPAGTESGRVLLYACPECGDIIVAAIQCMSVKPITALRGTPLLTRTGMKSQSSSMALAPIPSRSRPMKQP